jgi:hypothetical protein
VHNRGLARSFAFLARARRQSNAKVFGYTTSKNRSHAISGRRLVQGLVAGRVIAGLDLWRWPALAMKGFGIKRAGF